MKHQISEKEEHLPSGDQKQTNQEKADEDMPHPLPKIPLWQHDHSQELVVIVSGIVFIWV